MDIKLCVKCKYCKKIKIDVPTKEFEIYETMKDDGYHICSRLVGDINLCTGEFHINGFPPIVSCDTFFKKNLEAEAEGKHLKWAESVEKGFDLYWKVRDSLCVKQRESKNEDDCGTSGKYYEEKL